MTILARFFDPDDILEIRCIHPQRDSEHTPRSFWVKFSEIGSIGQDVVRLNKEGYGIYYGLLPRTEEGATKDGEVLDGKILWADFDHMAVEDAKIAVEDSPLPEPSIWVNSGHGAHAYWVLKEKTDPWQISNYVAKIAAEVNSDTSVRNPSRIFRVPNTVNTKEPRAKCEVVDVFEDVFQLSDFVFSERKKEGMYHPAPKQFPFYESTDKAVQDAAAYICKIPGSSQGGRTDAAYKVACVLINDFKVPESDSIDLLYQWDYRSNTPPINGCSDYKEGELERILENAKRYSKKPSGTKQRQTQSVDYKKAEIKTEKTEGLEELRGHLRSRAENTEPEITFKQFPRLETLTALGMKGQLIILAGPEGEGKSLFATNLCISAWRDGAKFAYLPLEDMRRDWQARALSIISGSWSPIGHKPEAARESIGLLQQYGALVEDISIGVAENPTKCDSIELEADVPLVSPESVLEWVYSQRENNDIIVVDCLSQIEFEDSAQHRGEGKFIKKLEALAKDKIIFLVCHTRRKDGKDRKAKPHADDVQGSKLITRRCHACILLMTHDEDTSEVYRQNQLVENVVHERTAYIAKARNASGKHQSIAVTMHTGGSFQELGVIKRG